MIFYRKKRLGSTVVVVMALFVLSGCNSIIQSTGLYKLGVGEKEITYIDEEHKLPCAQPNPTSYGRDKCDRIIIRDTRKR